MLIKVQMHRMSSRWKQIDSVNKPEFDQKSDEFRSAKDLQDYHKRQHTMYDGRVTLLIFDDIFWALYPEDQAYRNPDRPPIPAAIINEKHTALINTISYVDDEGFHRCLIFDGMAYICNDSGDTLDKVPGGGLLNYGDDALAA